MIRYDKIITVKVSIEQFDKVHNHASAIKKDASTIMRDLIDNIDTDESQIQKQIDYHDYNMKQLKAKLTKVRAVNDKQEKDKIKENESLKKQKIMKKNGSRVKEIASGITKKVGEKYQKKLHSDDKEEVEKAKKDVVRFVKEEVDKVEPGHVKEVIEQVTHYVSRLYFPITEKAIINEM